MVNLFSFLPMYSAIFESQKAVSLRYVNHMGKSRC